MAEYLDKGGLEHYHSLIKQKINAKADSSALANKADKTDLNHYLDLDKTTTQTMKGALYIGSATTNVGNAYTHQRKVTSNITGASVNGVAFAVAQTGEASFQHKVYDNSGGSAKNDAVLRFWKDHLQFANNTGSGNVPTEDMYKEIATQEYVDAQATPIATTDVAGKVKPDGTTITVTEDGTISSVGGGGKAFKITRW